MAADGGESVKADADAKFDHEILREFAVGVVVVAVAEHFVCPVALGLVVGHVDEVADVVGGDIEVDEARYRDNGERDRDPHADLAAEEEQTGGVMSGAAVCGVVFKLIGKGDSYRDLGRGL